MAAYRRTWHVVGLHATGLGRLSPFPPPALEGERLRLHARTVDVLYLVLSPQAGQETGESKHTRARLPSSWPRKCDAPRLRAPPPYEEQLASSGRHCYKCNAARQCWAWTVARRASRRNPALDPPSATVPPELPPPVQTSRRCLVRVIRRTPPDQHATETLWPKTPSSSSGVAARYLFHLAPASESHRADCLPPLKADQGGPSPRPRPSQVFARQRKAPADRQESGRTLLLGRSGRQNPLPPLCPFERAGPGIERGIIRRRERGGF